MITEETRKLIKRQGGKALIPKNGVCNGIAEDHDRAILGIRIFEGDKMARSIWRNDLAIVVELS